MDIERLGDCKHISFSESRIISKHIFGAGFNCKVGRQFSRTIELLGVINK